MTTAPSPFPERALRKAAPCCRGCGRPLVPVTVPKDAETTRAVVLAVVRARPGERSGTVADLAAPHIRTISKEPREVAQIVLATLVARGLVRREGRRYWPAD